MEQSYRLLRKWEGVSGVWEASMWVMGLGWEPWVVYKSADQRHPGSKCLGPPTPHLVSGVEKPRYGAFLMLPTSPDTSWCPWTHLLCWEREGPGPGISTLQPPSQWQTPCMEGTVSHLSRTIWKHKVTNLSKALTDRNRQKPDKESSLSLHGPGYSGKNRQEKFGNWSPGSPVQLP